jgi:ribosomal protein S12 methylthiotransferase accessory factor
MELNPLPLSDCFKTFRHDQDKVRTPEETLRWARERLRPLDLQILTETVRIDTGRLGIPVFISLCGDDATRLTGTKKQMGKGATPEQSEASAVMELMERFSFFSFIHQSRFPLRPYRDMAGQAIAPSMLSRSVYDGTTDPAVIENFLQDMPLRWAPAFNLTQGQPQWVPIDWFYLINEYNGPAAGNTLEEAVLQSLCEVVERHVGSVISHELRPTPVIDPDSLRDPAAIELVQRFRAQGIRLFLRDFSLDTGIPTVGTLAYDPETFPERSEIVFTAGTTSDPEKSLCRALTEIAQLAGDFENRTSYRPTLPKYLTLDEARYLMEGPGVTVPIEALPNLAHDNLKVEIQRCVAALAGIGLEVLVVDVTHPELGVPAVYTIIPGAHFLDHTRNTDFAQHAARTLVRSLSADRLHGEMQRLHDAFGPRYDLTFFLAHSLELQDQPQAALEFFTQALREHPDPQEISSIYIHMASCLKDLGQYDQALEALAKAEQGNSELKEIYNLRGFCLYQLKHHQEAIEAFERAIELDPGSGIDYANIGSNLRELGHLEEAIKLYQMALELDPDIDFARDNIAKLSAYLESGVTPNDAV